MGVCPLAIGSVPSKPFRELVTFLDANGLHYITRWEKNMSEYPEEMRKHWEVAVAKYYALRAHVEKAKQEWEKLPENGTRIDVTKEILAACNAIKLIDNNSPVAKKLYAGGAEFLLARRQRNRDSFVKNFHVYVGQWPGNFQCVARKTNNEIGFVDDLYDFSVKPHIVEIAETIASYNTDTGKVTISIAKPNRAFFRNRSCKSFMQQVYGKEVKGGDYMAWWSPSDGKFQKPNWKEFITEFLQYLKQ